MAKVFTITQGLENMGAMKTGGQGSVYKGRRIGEMITAVKLLPTPIFGEENEDKNLRDFKNEVQKLKRVNEKPNPNVVKILSSGLSETGNFPFIEMEYIEGPDLEELLQPPNAPVFTIKEVIKVAEQLSNALAHCHSLGVKHGDIKSNNVKFNIYTSNYVLLDFGLAIMSDEQRRTSLRHAGAVEFMAPEQNEGQMLFQTDVYSFGIVLFELLAGRVPFPLQDKGETARNNVRLAHMETLPPDVVSLRKDALPITWTQDKRASEMNIPQWLVSLIYKCIKKKPENRFANGVELHEYIIKNSIQPFDGIAMGYGSVADDIHMLTKEKEQLQQQVLQYKEQINKKEREIAELKNVINKDSKNVSVNQRSQEALSGRRNKGVSKVAFAALLLLTIGLAAYSGYSLFDDKNPAAKNRADANKRTTDTTVSSKKLPVRQVEKRKDTAPIKEEISTAALDTVKSSLPNTPKSVTPPPPEIKKVSASEDSLPAKQEPAEVPAKSHPQYMVTTKAYIYNTPDETTRRKAFVVPSNNAILNALDEQNDFIYVEFRNQLGQSSNGWLRKKDLQLLSE